MQKENFQNINFYYVKKIIKNLQKREKTLQKPQSQKKMAHTTTKTSPMNDKLLIMIKATKIKTTKETTTVHTTANS
jgi:hypothetical protein